MTAKQELSPAIGRMYPPEAHICLLNLMRSGPLSLDHFEETASDLNHANEAVAHAAARGGACQATVIQP